MAFYRKRPIVVAAHQYTGTPASLAEISEWIPKSILRLNTTNKVVKIQTPEGVMTVSVGDWVVRGIKGEFYPVKPDIFADTYEPAPEVRGNE